MVFPGFHCDDFGMSVFIRTVLFHRCQLPEHSEDGRGRRVRYRIFHSEWDGCESHIDGQIPSEQRIEEIGQEIAKRAEVSDVQFKSADEAWATFGPDYFGEDYAEGFPENPLAGEDSYEIF